MQLFQKLKEIPVAKLIGLAFLGVVIFAVAIWMLGFAFRTAFFGSSSVGQDSYEFAPYATKEYPANAPSVASFDQYRGGVVIPPPEPPYSPGDDAEQFEITEYNASLRTRKLDSTCSAFEGLKIRDEVIFEYANRFDHGCSYSFKVLKEYSDEIVMLVKNFKPETFGENTQTIKGTIDYYVNEEEILQKKLASIETTLLEAQSAYDAVQLLATQSKDIENLAKIIDSKVKLIERLTEERLNTKERLDRIARAKADQLDRLRYTFFRINISEVVLVDMKAIKNSWTNEISQFVREFNSVLQGITIQLAEFGLRVFQAALYILLAILVVKYGWIAVKIIWRGKRKNNESEIPL